LTLYEAIERLVKGNGRYQTLYYSILFLGTVSHVEVTASPGESNGMVMGRQRQGHGHGLKADKEL
jgi:hypothetical protein